MHTVLVFIETVSAWQAVAARALGLLSEDPTPTLKQLNKSILRLNNVPGMMRLRQDDIYDHAAFVSDQICNAEDLLTARYTHELR